MRSASTVLWRHSTGRRPITRRRKGRLGREVLPVIHVWDFTNPPVRLLGARNCKTSQTVTYHRAPGRERDRLRVTAGVRGRKARTPRKPRREDSVPRGSTSYGVTVAISAVWGDSQKTFVAQALSVPIQRTLPKLPIRGLADAESESAVRLFGITSCSRGAFLLQSSPVSHWATNWSVWFSRSKADCKKSP
jgi:hypothetical protein